MPSVNIEYVSEYTYISNLEQVAHSLKRRPMDILKYLGVKFGTIANNNSKKKGKGKGYGIKGKYTTEIIQESIFSFIDTFVICKNCNNPETYFIVKKKSKSSKLKMKCMSCRDSHLFDIALISKYDKKIVNHICSNPPELPKIVQKTQGKQQEVEVDVVIESDAVEVPEVEDEDDDDAFSDLDDDYFSEEAQQARLNDLGGIFAKKKTSQVDNSKSVTLDANTPQEEEEEELEEEEDEQDDENPFQQLTPAEIALENEKIAKAAVEAKELDELIEGL